MMANWKFFLWGCVFFSACSTTKNLPEGDALYTGAKVTLNANDITIRQKKVFRQDLASMTRPKPNSKVLGVPVKLILWNTLKAKKPTSLLGKLRSRLGEPPVLLSQVDLNANAKILENHLENKGFFNADVSGDTVVKRKKATAHYTANAGSQYKITSVEFINDSSVLTQTIAQDISTSLLKAGDPYDLDVIKGERNRIDAHLKEKGFYYFNPDYLVVHVDSSAGNHQVKMRVMVKPEVPTVAREVYFVNDVFIYSDYSLNTAQVDTVKSHAQFYKGYYVVDENKKYKPRLFEQAMQFAPGDVYNRTDHNRSLNRLINLNVFKFVKNRFERADIDSPKLNVYYYLTPFPSKSIRAEIGGNTKSNNLNGSQVSFGFHHRNFFRAGEQFDFRIYGGTEVSFGGTFQGYQTFRAGGEMNFAIPRFFIPVVKIKTKSGFVPRTNMQLAYELMNRKGLYSLNSFRAGLGYVWKQSTVKSHEFYPLTVTYVLPANITKKYRDDMMSNPTLRHITDTQFIMGSTYQFTLNEQAGSFQKINSFYFNGLADLSGNVAGLFVGKTNNNQKRLFNLPFSQYIKLEVDGRYYRKIGIGSSWVNRIVIGYGMPYGNSTQLPYIKQFFTGGNNSIRAFRSRTIGPGTYKALPTLGGYIPDQTGDIKLEFNTEFRPQISGPLYGALFIDAGNIWLKNNDPDKPGAQFTKDFIKQMAVGAGAGIRLDIQVFVIRFDVAIPVRKPWLSNPWVMNQINLSDKTWRKENIMFNLAIGYPF